MSAVPERWGFGCSPEHSVSARAVSETCPAVWRGLDHRRGLDRQDCRPLSTSLYEPCLWLQEQRVLCRGLRGDQIWLCYRGTRGGGPHYDHT